MSPSVHQESPASDSRTGLDTSQQGALKRALHLEEEEESRAEGTVMDNRHHELHYGTVGRVVPENLIVRDASGQNNMEIIFVLGLESIRHERTSILPPGGEVFKLQCC